MLNVRRFLPLALFIIGIQFSYSVGAELNLGVNCNSEIDTCLAENAECLSVGDTEQCACQRGYVENQDKSKCLESKDTIGGYCDETVQCDFENSACTADGEQKYCFCNDDYVPDDSFKQCYPKVGTIDKDDCEITKQCPRNAECKSDTNQCSCTEGFVKNFQGTACLDEAKALNDHCSEDIQCAGILSSYCNRVVGECRCISSHIASEDLSTCLTKTNAVGGLCEESPQCVVENSACVAYGDVKYCDCDADFVPDLNSLQKCYPEINTLENDICEVSNQCPSNAECKNHGDAKKCSCKEEFVSNPQGTLCLQVADKIGFICSSSAQCERINGYCFGPFGLEKCRCNQNTSPNLANTFCNPNDLGAPCQESIDCTANWENSECVSGTSGKVCKCVPGYVEINGECLEGIGGACPVNGNCPYENSNCVDNICQCNDGFVGSIDKKSCLKKAEKLNDECQERAQCSNIVSAICNTVVGECRCVSTHVPSLDLSTCLKKVSGLNTPCEQSDQCTTSNAQCLGGLCTCKDNFVQGGNFCLEKIDTLGEGCRISAQCTPANSVCVAEQLICDCETEFVRSENNKTCLPLVDFGEPCLELAQCTLTEGDVTCSSEGKCACDAGNIFAENMCWQRKSLDEQCTKTIQCQLAENSERVHCLDDKCQCKASYIPDKTNNICNTGAHISIAMASLLSSHKADGHFILPASESQRGSAMASIRIFLFVFLASLVVLSRAENIGETCDAAVTPPQCPDNAECKEGEGGPLCECVTGYVSSDNKERCLKVTSAIDEVCEQNSQCPIEQSSCTDSKCQCNPGWVDSSDKLKCLEILSNFDDTCEESAQCNTGVLGVTAVCGESGKCTCTEGTVENSAGDKCIQGAVRLGESCSDEPNICNTVENSECNAEDMCACKDSFVASLTGEKCLAVVDGSLGNPCEENSQCNPKIPNTECVDNKCACKINFVGDINAASCLAYAGYGEECKENSQCTAETDGQVSCVLVEGKSICQCKPQNHYITPKCWFDRKLNEQCTDKKECILSDGQSDRVDCIENMCTCTSAYVADFEQNKCNSGVRNSLAIIIFAIAALFLKMC
ncbi:Hypothetical predicted protein [Cloeon dipterum]|uniref:EGF-like domain-containing protein n=1 Tax=Cloeon dipterum TaxID=197152 RepID=A0A8S1CBK6_9INSE|nr:Hypothetical predicted protein [Cloeon dipterum]